MGSPVDLVSFVARSPNRVEALSALADGPGTRAEVQERTGIPRATLSRILADFRERDLATRSGHDFELTPLGDVLADELGSLLAAVDAVQRLEAVRGWLDVEDFGFPVGRLADADLVIPTDSDPLAPIRRAEALLADARQVRAVANSAIPGCIEAVWRAVTDGRQTLEWATTPAALEVIAADPELARLVRDLLESPDAAAYVQVDGFPQALFVVDEVVFTPVKDGAGTIQGHVETDDPVVRKWAHEAVDAYLAAAEPIGVEVLTA